MMANTPELIITSAECTTILTERGLTREDEIEIFSEESFGIDSARLLKQAVYSTPLTKNIKYIVIKASGITKEAQNALLKVCEEPPVTTQILALLPSEDVLLPTLRSRFIVSSSQVGVPSQVTSEFLKLTMKDRLATITVAQKEKKLEWFHSLLQGLQSIDTKGYSDEAKKALLIADTYKNVPSANKKMLAEELALTLPVIK